MASGRGYVPGECISSGYPYVQIVKKGSELCANCFERSFSLKYCLNCKFVRYCSKKCQKESWADHKLECPLLKDLPEKNEMNIRLIGLLILKIKGKKWEDIYEILDGKKVTFADIMTHSAELKKPDTSLYVTEISELLRRYIGDKNLPKEHDLCEIIGKVTFNRLKLGDGPDVAYALYLIASQVVQSCIPNAEFNLRKRKLMIQAIVKIRQGEKITVSYCPSVCDPFSKKLFDKVLSCFSRSCHCEDCSKPYGESVLTKIIDKSKAFSAVEASETILNQVHVLLNLKIPLDVVIDVNYILKEQEGVLGNTNILRMRMLALKCMCVKIHPLEKRMALEKLLKYMKEVFGDYHREVRFLYLLLLNTNIALGDMEEMARVHEKMTTFADMGLIGFSYD